MHTLIINIEQAAGKLRYNSVCSLENTSYVLTSYVLTGHVLTSHVLTSHVLTGHVLTSTNQLCPH
jgi:hypothetical protein